MFFRLRNYGVSNLALTQKVCMTILRGRCVGRRVRSASWLNFSQRSLRLCGLIFFTAQSAEDAEIESYTFTPKRYPTNAERTIAMVPQIRIRITAFRMLDPPVLAETAPRMMSDRIVKP